MLNLGEVEIKGVDAVLNALFTLGKLEVTTKFQYTYQKAIDITDPADTYYRDQIPYIPWHSGSAILALFYKGWGLNYSFIYTGQRYNQQENIPRNHTQPWYTSDLSLQRLSRSAPEPSRPRPRLTIFRTGLRRGAQLSDAEDQLPVRRQRRSLTSASHEKVSLHRFGRLLPRRRLPEDRTGEPHRV